MLGTTISVDKDVQDEVKTALSILGLRNQNDVLKILLLYFYENTAKEHKALFLSLAKDQKYTQEIVKNGYRNDDVYLSPLSAFRRNSIDKFLIRNALHPKMFGELKKYYREVYTVSEDN